MIIAKFGGTSVNTASRIQTICDIVRSERKDKPIVVVSALAEVTNLLLSLPLASTSNQSKTIAEIRKLHKILIEELFTNESQQQKPLSYLDTQLSELEAFVKRGKNDKESIDRIVSVGEIISSFIVAYAFEQKGIPAKQIIATDIIVTDNTFGSAEFLIPLTAKKTKAILMPLVNRGIVPVVTGFIGSTKGGRTTTLGRGGSDYTASIIGFCLKASEIQIWTDVDGIYTADPRFIKKATLIPTISFKEASELATFGARVLHPRTIKPAIKAGIPVRVLNTLNPKSSGTMIVEKPKLRFPIRAVSSKKNITLVNIYATQMLLQKGFLAKVFDIFAKHSISIDLVSVSEVSVSVTLDNNQNLAGAIRELYSFSQVNTTKNLGIVAIVGKGIGESIDTINEIFAVLSKNHILVKMVSLGASDINISLVLSNNQVEKAVEVLHDTIVLGRKKL